MHRKGGILETLTQTAPPPQWRVKEVGNLSALSAVLLTSIWGPQTHFQDPRGLLHQAGFKAWEEEALRMRDKTAFKLPKQVWFPWWSVVQISVFAIVQVLTTVLNKTGFTSWVDNLHHRNFLVRLTGSRLIYIELDRTGPQSLVKAFIPFHFLMADILQRTNRGPRVGAKWWHSWKLWPTVPGSCRWGLIPRSYSPTKKETRKKKWKKRKEEEGKGKKSLKQTTARQLRSISCSMLFRSPRPFRCTNRVEGRTRSWI